MQAETRAELLREILAHPRDDGPRLVYADWLLSGDDRARGELIVVQCELAHLADDADGARRQRLLGRVRELIRGGRQRWLTEIGLHTGVAHEYRRGFVEKLDLSARRMLRRLPDIARLTPLDDVALSGQHHHDVTVLIEQGGLAGVRRLERRHGLLPVLLGTLARSSHASSLRTLDLAHGTGGLDPGVLLGASHLQLEALALPQCGLDEILANQLAHATGFARLRRLEVTGNRIGLDGMAALVASGVGLEELEAAAVVRRSFFGLRNPGPRLARLIASSSRLTRLRRLNLDANPLGDEGVASLVESPHLAALRHLSLGNVGLTGPGARAIATIASLRLDVLALGDNPIGDVGAIALLDSPSLAEVRELHLPRTGLGARALRHLTALSLPRLEVLDVAGNDLDRAALEALLDAPQLPRLRQIAHPPNATPASAAQRGWAHQAHNTLLVRRRS